MAFISFPYNRDKSLGTKANIYTLVDSEFEVDLVLEGDDIIYVEVANEYIKRNMPVGKALARFTIWYANAYGISIDSILRWQDYYGATDIENWEQYAQERDAALQRLLPLL